MSNYVALYSMQGCNALEDRESAWARLLGLFSLIYSGSSLHTLPVHEYGGLLSRSGQPDSPDATLRAIALFESLDSVTILLLPWYCVCLNC